MAPLSVIAPDIESARKIVKGYRNEGFVITLHPMHTQTTKITPQTIIGAVVESVDIDGECIECIHLRLSDGRGVDVNVNSEARSYYSWMEVM